MMIPLKETVSLRETASLRKIHSAAYQCFRLYSCIQAAVARAVDSDKSKQWAIRRVNILLDLIPQQPTFPLVNDESLFYAGLVKLIHSIPTCKEPLPQQQVDDPPCK